MRLILVIAVIMIIVRLCTWGSRPYYRGMWFGPCWHIGMPPRGPHGPHGPMGHRGFGPGPGPGGFGGGPGGFGHGPGGFGGGGHGFGGGGRR